MEKSLSDAVDSTISASRLTALLRGSTYATLLVEHGSAVVPLRELAEPYLGTSVERAHIMAKQGIVGLPVFRAGGSRSPWLVHLYDLAKHIDAQRSEAGSEHVVEETEEAGA
jgi:hypothetical protein